MIRWRAMRTGDLDAVMTIAAALHPGYPERVETFADKLAFHGQACRILEEDGRAAGYGFAHRWCLGLPPLLDAPLGRPPAAFDCVHLHDVALVPQVRGQGGVETYLDHLEELAAAEGFAHLGLVAVTGKDGYWRGKGFGRHKHDAPDLERRLASYGPGNVYLVRRLTKLKESDTQIA